jgi:FkbM family methyltransferase
MNLRTFASHTLDLDLLPEAPRILDVGCRGFDFTREVLAVRNAGWVIAMDPARDVREWWKSDAANGLHKTMRVRYVAEGLVGSGHVTQKLAHFSTGEGDFVTHESQHMPGWDIQPEWYDVECWNISELMLRFAIEHFDAVKLDCEGSEFGILENWPGPIATQISVEFHDWDKPQYRAEGYYEALWKKLPWYRVVQHELSKQGEGVGHWDTLLVLNEKR